MMNALHAGGLPVIFQPEQEKFNKEINGFAPNPSKLLEVGQQYYMNAHFLRNIPDDSLIKVLYDGLPCLPLGKYTIVFMLRDEAEINDSLARSDAHLRTRGVKPNPPKPFTFDVFRPYKQEDIDHVLGIMSNRMDVNLIKVQYKDVVDDPIGLLQSICESPLGRLRIPIDIETAAKTIQPGHYRSKNENDTSRSKGTPTQSSH